MPIPVISSRKSWSSWIPKITGRVIRAHSLIFIGKEKKTVNKLFPKTTVLWHIILLFSIFLYPAPGMFILT